MAYGRVEDRFLIVVHALAAPTADEWDQYLRDCERWTPQIIGVLIETHGGAPSADQRRAMRDMADRTGPIVYRTAVVSSSLLVRGITGAINLFNRHIRAFRPEALDEAIAHMRGALHRDAIRAELEFQRGRLASPPA